MKEKQPPPSLCKESELIRLLHALNRPQKQAVLNRMKSIRSKADKNAK